MYRDLFKSAENWNEMSRNARKQVFEVFDQVQHKLGCIITEYS